MAVSGFLIEVSVKPFSAADDHMLPPKELRPRAAIVASGVCLLERNNEARVKAERTTSRNCSD